MRYYKLFLILFLCLTVVACTSSTMVPANTLDSDNIYDINQLNYSKFSYNVIRNDWDKEVGNIEINLLPDDGGSITIYVNKLYTAEFLTAIKETVENKREYIINQNFSLVSLNESEKIGSDNRLDYIQTATYKNDYTKVETKISGKEEHNNSIILPPGERVFSKEMGFISLMFNKQVGHKTFHFYLDSSGMTVNYKLLKSETIKTDKYGEREAYKLHSTYPNDTYIWIDKEEHVILKKEEHLSGGVILTMSLTSMN